MAVESDVGAVHDGEDGRGDSDRGWPESDEEVCERGVGDCQVEPDLFKNVELMFLTDGG